VPRRAESSASLASMRSSSPSSPAPARAARLGGPRRGRARPSGAACAERLARELVVTVAHGELGARRPPGDLGVELLDATAELLLAATARTTSCRPALICAAISSSVSSIDFLGRPPCRAGR
jgi:hypothetical protein